MLSASRKTLRLNKYFDSNVNWGVDILLHFMTQLGFTVGAEVCFLSFSPWNKKLFMQFFCDGEKENETKQSNQSETFESR